MAVLGSCSTPSHTGRTSGLFRVSGLVFAVISIALAAFPIRTDAQPAVPLIDTVIVTTDGDTKPYVILNEMSLQKGMGVTTEAVEYDRNRIYSLGLFTSVDIIFDSVYVPRVLHVVVQERWHIFPVPVFGFRDGDFKKPYYGAGFLHNNFQGRNQKLYASLIFGYDPSAALSFVDPLLDRKNNLFFSGSAGFQRVHGRSEIQSSISGSYNEEHYDITGSIGKRFSLYESAGIGLGYNVVSVSEYYPSRTISTDGVDRYIDGSLSYTYDSRDLAEYPSRGKMMLFYVSKSGFGESEVNFSRVGTDLRGFLPLPLSFTLAARAQGSVVWGGEVPTHSHVFFGYGERIRGYFDTVREGENIVGTTVELRYPLFPARTFYIGFIPLPPEFAVWRFGVSLALFADAGTVWYRGDKLTLNSFSSGYGGGIHFLLPYSLIMRVEYAFNDYGKGEFILDFRRSL
jgi:outer membrane protein assembly factor BamA